MKYFRSAKTIQGIAALAATAYCLAGGSPAKAAALSASAASSLNSLQVLSTSVAGGDKIGARLTLTAPAPQNGVTVSVTTNSVNATIASSTIFIPAGAAQQTFDIVTKPVTQVSSVTITAKLGSASRSASLMVAPAASPFAGSYVGAVCTPASRQGAVAAAQLIVTASGAVTGSFQQYGVTGQSQTIPFTGTLTNKGMLSLAFSPGGGATGTIVRNGDNRTFVGVLQERLAAGGTGERLFIALGTASASAPISGNHRGSIAIAGGSSLTALSISTGGALALSGTGIGGTGYEDAAGNIYAAYAAGGAGHIVIARLQKGTNSVALAGSVLTNGDTAGSCRAFTGSMN